MSSKMNFQSIIIANRRQSGRPLGEITSNNAVKDTEKYSQNDCRPQQA